MKIQGIVSDVRQQIEVAGRNYQGAFKAYIDAQRKALAVVTSGGTSLANTEIGAAKNIFSSARASFERARKDGVRKLASEPKSYAPKSRAQLISAYKSTIDQLVKTGSELNDVVTTGYRNVLGQLTGATEKQVEKSTEKPVEKSVAPEASGRKTASRRKTAAKPATSKTTAGKTNKPAAAAKKTATKSTAKSAANKTAKPKTAAAKPAEKTASTASTSASKKSAAPRKQAASKTASASAANKSTDS